MRFSHKPVMLQEVLEGLMLRGDGEYLDCTFGAGGYSAAILNSCDCSVIALDRDPNVIKYVEELKKQYPYRFNFVESNFSDAVNKLRGKNFDGIVLDLGVSSMQLDDPRRGFSFSHDGPLDMRMSSTGITAEEFINSAEESEIADVIYKYGDEPFSRRIARKIVQFREKERINTTGKLAMIVRSSIGFRKGKIDTATKTFQAIRIYINNELRELEEFLLQVKDMLKTNGRLVIVSFHSLEDRLVKNFFKENAIETIARSKYAKEEICKDLNKWLNIITKKVQKPTEEEVFKNQRSRSAKLRVAQKI